ncbi:RfaG Glycosyltransferase [Burkholderiaceae bacterium]
MIKVLISNGHFKFILGAAAAEASDRGILDGFIAGGYPTKYIKLVLNFLKLGGSLTINRLLNREERVPDSLVHTQWISEFFIKIASTTRKLSKSTKYSEYLDDFALKIYSIGARLVVYRSDANIYHYRSGYGHSSAKMAKKKGMFLLCDHSIAHPMTISYLIDHGGELPKNNENLKISKFWKSVVNDLNLADAILVNSDFVKKTFINQGWSSEKVHVIYTGIDDQFLKKASAGKSSNKILEKPRKFLFAGDFCKRKGAIEIMQAFTNTSDLDWRLEIIGNLDPELDKETDLFFKNQRVKYIPFMPRLALAEKMLESDVFVFPSLAEGSATVIYMAMVCGCYIITTENSGSVVKDGIHGEIIDSGNISALENSIRRVINANNDDIYRICKINSETIIEKYNQKKYGNDLEDLYKSFIINRQDII